MRRSWLACAALGWSFAVTMFFAVSSSVPGARSGTQLPSLLAVPPILAIPLLSCVAAVLAWRRRPVQVASAIPIFVMCFLGLALYLPAAVALLVAGLDRNGDSR